MSTTEEKPRRSEARLIAKVHAGLGRMNEAALDIGQALRELRGDRERGIRGPKSDLTREQWGTWLEQEFELSRATAVKFMGLAEFDERCPQLPDGSRWNRHMPPNWTTQYAIVSRLSREPDRVIKAIESGEIKPTMRGKDIATLAGGGGGGGHGDAFSEAVKDLLTIVKGELYGVSYLSDEQVTTIGTYLEKVLAEVQREALRDLLAG